MTWQSWAYIAIFAAWAVVEAIGLVQKDRPVATPGHPMKLRTLSANLRWLVQGAGPWHHYLRYGFIFFLAWFRPHILGG